MAEDNRQLVRRRVGGEWVVRDEDAGRVYFLNQVAIDVWDLLSEIDDVDRAVGIIAKRYSETADYDVREHVLECRSELASLGLLTPGSRVGGECQ